MMNLLEEAILYATVMYQGKVRKFKGIPFILHPLEMAYAEKAEKAEKSKNRLQGIKHVV